MDTTAPAIMQQQPGAPREQHGEGSGRRRRDHRRGRDRDRQGRHGTGEARGEHGGRQHTAPAAEAVPPAETMPSSPPAGDAAIEPHAQRIPDQGFEAPNSPPESAAPRQPSAAMVEHVEAVRAPAPAPIPRNAPDIPRVSLELPAGSELVLVETSSAVTTLAQPEAAAPRAHRVRPPRVESKDEPLQMVETTRKEPSAE